MIWLSCTVKILKGKGKVYNHCREGYHHPPREIFPWKISLLPFKKIYNFFYTKFWIFFFFFSKGFCFYLVKELFRVCNLYVFTRKDNLFLHLIKASVCQSKDHMFNRVYKSLYIWVVWLLEAKLLYNFKRLLNTKWWKRDFLEGRLKRIINIPTSIELINYKASLAVRLLFSRFMAVFIFFTFPSMFLVWFSKFL